MGESRGISKVPMPLCTYFFSTRERLAEPQSLPFTKENSGTRRKTLTGSINGLSA